MKLGQLQALIAIAREGSINRAAESLGATQPAISKSVRALERELGAELLIRGSKGVSLTPYGEVALKRSLAIFREIEKTGEEIAWLRGSEAGRLSIGLTPIASDLSVAAALARVRQEKPKIEIAISELRPRLILDGLASGRLDVGLISLYGSQSLPSFETQLVRRLPARLICGDSSAANENIDSLMLREWVDYDPRDDQDSFVKMLAAACGRSLPLRVTHCTSMLLAIELVVRFGAVCAVAESGLHHLRGRLDAGDLIIVDSITDLPTMNVVVAFRDWETLAPAARKFVHALRLDVLPGYGQQ